jgi:hypothetical protein
VWTPGEWLVILALAQADPALALQRCYYVAGYAAALDDLAWHIGGRIMPAQPGELELRRYPPHGRARFGEPRAGDYPGRWWR